MTIVAVAALLAGLLVDVGPADRAEAAGWCAHPDVRWVGAAGDGRWSTAANWLDTSGSARVPGRNDTVCIDTTVSPSTGVVADVAASIEQLEVTGGLDAPTFHVQAPVVAAEDLEVGSPTILEGTDPVLGTDPASSEISRLDAPVQIAPGTTGAVLQGRSTFLGLTELNGPTNPDVTLDVGADLTIVGLFLQYGATTVRANQTVTFRDFPNDTGRIWRWSWNAPLTVEPGGSVTDDGPIGLEVRAGATLTGAMPDLTVGAVQHDGAFPLDVHGVPTAVGVGADAALRILPDGSGRQGVDSPSLPVEVAGRLELSRASGPSVPIAAPTFHVAEGGVAELSNVDVTARLDVDGDLVVHRQVRAELPEGIDGPHEIGGHLSFEPASVDDLPRLTVDGGLRTTGTITGPTVTHGTWTLARSSVVVGGLVDAVGSVGTMVSAWDATWDHPGVAGVRLHGLSLSGSDVVSDVAGLAGDQHDRISSTDVGFIGNGSRLQLRVAPGYVPCPGSRWQVLRSALPPSFRDPAIPPVDVVDGPAWLTAHAEALGNGLVIVADGTPSGACDDPVTTRWVAATYLDLVDRPADAPGLASWAPTATTAAGRQRVATALRTSTEGWRRAVQAEYLRQGVLPDDAGTAYWVGQLRAGRPMDQLRATLLGSAAVARDMGQGTPVSDDAWVSALYRRELGRAADPAGRAWALGRLAQGATRARVAGELLGEPEADRALVRRWAQGWLGRAPTAAELSTWTAPLAHQGSEVPVQAAVLSALTFG